MIASSPAMSSILAEARQVADSHATVLITGESGTGKEIIARNIFDHSPRREKPYVTINCAAIPESLLESELFGHERGAFTGADSRKIGKFEAAHRGTILLDEIGDMPLPLQGKILRVLEDKRIERLGGTTPVTVDVRFLAATNKNLERMVEEGSFRGDLYYRLKVMHLDLPPLRERKEDIPLLAEHLLERMGKRVRVTGAAMELLVSYDWPGNVRELQNVLERAVVLSGRRAIEPQHLALQGIAPLENEARAAQQLPLDKGLDHHLANIEKKAIIQALQHAGGVQVQAARLLGVKERSLWHRVKKHDIDVARFKPNKK
jgi:transcriptional regulator with GAF, ATPase, and Fis domain